VFSSRLDAATDPAIMFRGVLSAVTPSVATARVGTSTGKIVVTEPLINSPSEGDFRITETALDLSRLRRTPLSLDGQYRWKAMRRFDHQPPRTVK
jgi:hypothetical protein